MLGLVALTSRTRLHVLPDHATVVGGVEVPAYAVEGALDALVAIAWMADTSSARSGDDGAM